jgi:1,2-diacylglycerol 3-alpha-glucosyltransferase
VIKVVPGGVDVTSFANLKIRDRLRKKYNLQGKFVLLWIGRLSYEKSLEVLIGAIAELSGKQPRARLVLIGDGPARKELEFYARALEVEDKIIFLGERKYEELARQNYYALGDIFVTASTFETQGLTINEAMAAGLSIVGVRSRAVPDLIKGCGLLSRPDDPVHFAKNVNKLIKNTRLREALAKRARERAVDFSVDSSVSELIGVYESLIQQKRKK